MNGYDAAVTAWARKFLGDDSTHDYGYVDGRYQRTNRTPWADKIDWSKPAELAFDYEEPYQYSEYTGGGGTGQITVRYHLIDGGWHDKIYADLDDLNRTEALPKLIQQILAESW